MRALVLLVLALAGVANGYGAESTNQAATFYLQLVRGSDSDGPPEAGAAKVGPVLSQKLRSVFKWRNYWELKRECITVRLATRVRRRLNREREVEVEWLKDAKLEVRIYERGKMTYCQRQPVTTPYLVRGGDRSGDESWFIVLRRDKPTQAENDLD